MFKLFKLITGNNSNPKSWRTSVSGISSIVLGVSGLVLIVKIGIYNDVALAIGFLSLSNISNGIGNLFAKDNDITGVTGVNAKRIPTPKES